MRFSLALLAVVAATSFPARATAQSLLYENLGGAWDEAYGSALAGLGDVDGDGRPDFAAGAPRADFGGFNAGSVRVHSGASGALLYTLNGVGDSHYYGTAVAGVGDVDADGRGDLLVGEPMEIAIPGRVHLYSGATGSLIRTHTSGLVPDVLGRILSALGDVDGDSVPDYAVYGSPSTGPFVRIYSGASGAVVRTHVLAPSVPSNFRVSFATSGDTDGDGRADYLIALPYQNNYAGLVTLHSGASGAVIRTHAGHAEELGHGLAGLGDFDGDGRSDYALGGPRKLSVGEVLLCSGASGSVVRVIPAELSEPAPHFGHRLAPAGDWDGDGLPDLVAAAEYGSMTASSAGRVRVYSCSTGKVLATFDGQEGGWRLGAEVAALGDVDLDGRPEILAHAVHGPGHVRVFTPVALAPTAYCVATVNSTGVGAHLGWAGSTSLSANDFVPIASGVPPGRFGQFLFNFDVASAAYGDGVRCIGGQAFYRLPVAFADPAGILSSSIDWNDPSHPAFFSPGSNPKFQLWYRDPGGPGGTGFNTSDALSVQLCP